MSTKATLVKPTIPRANSHYNYIFHSK